MSEIELLSDIAFKLDSIYIALVFIISISVFLLVIYIIYRFIDGFISY